MLEANSKRGDRQLFCGDRNQFTAIPTQRNPSITTTTIQTTIVCLSTHRLKGKRFITNPVMNQETS
ncbi:MAG: hypothetical protein AAFY26_17110 [Cyanobacteria bacterium J06638_22]